MNEWKKLDEAVRELYIVVLDELPFIKILVERLDLFLRKLQKNDSKEIDDESQNAV